MLLQPTTPLFAEPTLPEVRSDRRAHPRIPGRLLRVTRVRISNRPGVSLVDLSPGGALLQLTFQARPGSRFAVQLQTPAEKLELPFKLLRCYVADIRDRVTYHAAGEFEGLLDLQRIANRASDAVPTLVATLEQLHTAGQKS
ncbi:MAG TPA: PilZ domain-containing protein, partial [Vicinamibacterales bacterium]|nr:PilZ domain-containing protein [Vicinamibacterales bacterium]